MKGDVKRNNSPVSWPVGHHCRDSQPHCCYGKPCPAIRYEVVHINDGRFGELNSSRDDACRPWIYLSLAGYRCFRSCEGG